MFLDKKQIKETLLKESIQSSQDAGKLLRWVVKNKQRFFPDVDSKIVTFNFYDNDHMMVYILRVTRKIDVTKIKPCWSFLWFESSKITVVIEKEDETLLTIQLGAVDSADGRMISPKFPPIVTSESGVFVF